MDCHYIGHTCYDLLCVFLYTAFVNPLHTASNSLSLLEVYTDTSEVCHDSTERSCVLLTADEGHLFPIWLFILNISVRNTESSSAFQTHVIHLLCENTPSMRER